jgi:hypothetical protein
LEGSGKEAWLSTDEAGKNRTWSISSASETRVYLHVQLGQPLRFSHLLTVRWELTGVSTSTTGPFAVAPGVARLTTSRVFGPGAFVGTWNALYLIDGKAEGAVSLKVVP